MTVWARLTADSHRVGEFTCAKWNSPETLKCMIRGKMCGVFALWQIKLRKIEKKETEGRRKTRVEKKPSVQAARKDDSPTRPHRSQTNLYILQLFVIDTGNKTRKSNRNEMERRRSGTAEHVVNASSSTSSSIPEINLFTMCALFPCCLINRVEHKHSRTNTHEHKRGLWVEASLMERKFIRIPNAHNVSCARCYNFASLLSTYFFLYSFIPFSFFYLPVFFSVEFSTCLRWNLFIPDIWVYELVCSAFSYNFFFLISFSVILFQAVYVYGRRWWQRRRRRIVNAVETKTGIAIYVIIITILFRRNGKIIWNILVPFEFIEGTNV